MFDIKIGTVLPVEHALEMLPLLKPLGFEGYELTCGHYFAGHDIRESAKALRACPFPPWAVTGTRFRTI